MVAHQIRPRVGGGIFQGIAHAGLGGEMDDQLELLLGEGGTERHLVGDIGFGKAKFAALFEHRQPRLFQAEVVVRLERIDS